MYHFYRCSCSFYFKCFVFIAAFAHFALNVSLFLLILKSFLAVLLLLLLNQSVIPNYASSHHLTILIFIFSRSGFLPLPSSILKPAVSANLFNGLSKFWHEHTLAVRSSHLSLSFDVIRSWRYRRLILLYTLRSRRYTRLYTRRSRRYIRLYTRRFRRFTRLHIRISRRYACLYTRRSRRYSR